MTRSSILIQSFREKDSKLVDEVLGLDIAKMTEEQAMSKFYWFIAFPVQGVCRILKRIGGKWVQRQVDGDKFVCMDNMVLGKPCVIYSFGIGSDWTFEDFMDYQGCEIRSYDPTVDFPATRGDNISFQKKGLGAAKDATKDTLANILAENGHTDTMIEYLKIDIEGHELSGFPNWLSTGALNNVHQIALELHLTSLHSPVKFKGMLEILQQLYKMNFRVISHEVNMVVGPGAHNLYNLVEVVFMKTMCGVLDVWRVLINCYNIMIIVNFHCVKTH